MRDKGAEPYPACTCPEFGTCNDCPEELRAGWTKAEYGQCPDLANRLHSRILDLEDEVARLREAA